MFKNIKNIPLSAIASRFGIEMSTGSHKKLACPACGSASFKVRDNKYFKCYRCGESGDGANLLYIAGVTESASAAVGLIAREFGIKSDLKSLMLNEKRRGALLSIAFNAFCDEMVSGEHTEAMDYYLQRGWSPNLVGSKEVGFCPNEFYLQNKLQFSADEIELCGLGSPSSGWEFMSNRIVFPVKKSGEIAHMQGRCVDSEAELRWVCSRGTPPITQYLYNADSLLKGSYKEGFLCEGISDAFSIRQLGSDIGVVGTFGINFSAKLLTSGIGTRVQKLYAVFDNDTYPIGSPNQNDYKSWSVVLKSLIEFSSTTETPVYCFMGNGDSNSDVNKILLELSYKRADFMSLVRANSRALPTLALDQYKNSAEDQHLIWRSLAPKYDAKDVESVHDSLDKSIRGVAKAFTSASRC